MLFPSKSSLVKLGQSEAAFVVVVLLNFLVIKKDECVCAHAHAQSVVSNALLPHGLQAPLSMEYFRQEYWSGLSFPRGSSQPRDRTCVSCAGRCTLCHCPPTPPEALLLPRTIIIATISCHLTCSLSSPCTTSVKLVTQPRPITQLLTYRRQLPGFVLYHFLLLEDMLPSPLYALGFSLPISVSLWRGSLP